MIVEVFLRSASEEPIGCRPEIQHAVTGGPVVTILCFHVSPGVEELIISQTFVVLAVQ